MIETIFEALTGLRYSGGNVIGLVLTFGLGFVFGKLTRNVGLIKGFFAVIFGLYFWSMFQNAYGAVILAFLLGVVANHINFLLETVLWAQDIQDIWFAHKYRKAFEDIKQQEREFEAQQAKARREAYQRQQSRGESQKQQQWREQTQDSSGGSQKASSTGSSHQKQKSPYDAYYATMGLDPSLVHSKENLKKAYHRRAKKVHPDAGGTDVKFNQLGEAYQRLIKSL